MRKILALMLVGALAGAASASVQIFYTGEYTGQSVGLTNPAMAFWPTEGNHTDITDGDYAVNAFPSWTPFTVTSSFAYVWLRFNDEPNGRRINGLDLDASAGNPTASWYILDDTGGDVGNKRWDGAYTLPNAPEFQTAHKVLVGATAYGLRNLSNGDPGWLYSGGTSRTYLLGALSFPSSSQGTYTLALGTAGINYSGGYSAPTVEFGSIEAHVPEPAALGLLGFMGLLVRRR